MNSRPRKMDLFIFTVPPRPRVVERLEKLGLLPFRLCAEAALICAQLLKNEFD